MTLKEYFEKNPGLLDQFKKCNSKDEFMQVAQENNMRFSGDRLDEVYAYVLKEKGGEIGEDVLEKASGGTGNSEASVFLAGGLDSKETAIVM